MPRKSKTPDQESPIQDIPALPLPAEERPLTPEPNLDSVQQPVADTIASDAASEAAASEAATGETASEAAGSETATETAASEAAGSGETAEGVRKTPRRRRGGKKKAGAGSANAAGSAEPDASGAGSAEAELQAGPDAAEERPLVGDPSVLADSAFARMNLSQETLSAVAAMGFREPTSVQEQTIPPMMDWRDVIAQAPTGTGKTVAFGIPIIEHFDPELADVQALILAPTRELALQITDELRALARNKPEIRIATIYGGQRIDRQFDELKHRPQVIVATPGRLIDHLNRRTVALGSVRTVILDEADRMLDMGFVRDVRKILDKMPRAWQVSMFSATMSRAVMDISWIYQRDVIELKVAAEAEDKPQITQYSIEVGSHRRIEVIADLMKKHNYQKVIIFCNRKYATDYVARRLSATGIRAESIHGDIQQSSREKTLTSFRTGSLRVLVATDVAARGIDVEGVDAVFNYDIPDENEYYVHRIGRTGRARHEGVAYTFTTLMTQPKLDEIMRYTKVEITPLKVD